MSDFLVRYEKLETECKKALGRSMLEGEAKGFHVLEQANISENQKQMVLAACGTKKLEYATVKQILKRVFENLGESEKEDCYTGYTATSYQDRGRNRFRGRRGGVEGGSISSSSRGFNRGRGGRGRNPVNREGKVTLCAICGSEWHWARDCPENYANKSKKEEGEGKKDGGHTEKVYFSNTESSEMEKWNEIDLVLDTGCESTICGEL